jgi:F-type H+-transporting ATPase subunit epsilon
LPAEIIELEVITSTDVVVKTTITELYIPAYYGQAGILEHHLPYVSILQAGEIAYRDSQGIKHYLFVYDGFLKTLHNKITIVSDRVEMEEDLDKSEIEARYKELTQKIKAAPKGDMSADELEQALNEQKEIKIKVDMLKKIERK